MHSASAHASKGTQRVREVFLMTESSFELHDFSEGVSTYFYTGIGGERKELETERKRQQRQRNQADNAASQNSNLPDEF